jgi:hypothetical protein
MDRRDTRIRATQFQIAEMTLRRQQRCFFARLTQPIVRARMSKLLLTKMGRPQGHGAPFK